MASLSAADIAEALGGAPHQSGRYYRAPCPACGSTRHNLSLWDRQYDLGIRCFRGCDSADVKAALLEMGLLGNASSYDDPAIDIDAQEPTETSRTTLAIAMWGASLQALGTPIEPYLRIARGIPLREVPPTLRFIPAGDRYSRHADGGRDYPIMLAAVIDCSGAIVAIHRTWLRPDGSDKAPIEPCRKALGPVAGSAVRLGDWWSGPLVIGEGIETALAASVWLQLPAWAALTWGGIESLILPDVVRDVVVAVDRDANGVGEDAARCAAMQWLAEGRRVRLIIPHRIGADCNDLLRENSNGSL